MRRKEMGCIVWTVIGAIAKSQGGVVGDGRRVENTAETRDVEEHMQRVWGSWRESHVRCASRAR